MTAIVRNPFRIRNAKDFVENFADAAHTIERNMYLFVGRTRPWPIDDLTPPLPTDSFYEEKRIRDAILGCKKIVGSYGSLVVPRYDWDSSGNTVYIPFDDRDPDLYFHPTPEEVQEAETHGNYTAGSCYVMTDEYHVFKCLANGNGAKSTDKPQFILTAPFICETVDGYKWKYLTTVTQTQVTRFLTDQWMPVITLTTDDGSVQWDVQESAVDGTIEVIAVDNPGSNYKYVHTGLLQTGGVSVTKVLIASNASDDTNAYAGSYVYIPTLGLVREITNYNAVTKEITVDQQWTVSPGDQYEIRPKIVITGNGLGATAKVVVDTDIGTNQYKVKNIIILTGGTGYTYAEAEITGGGGSGAIVHPILPIPGGHGSNIEVELGAFFAMLNVKLQYQEGAGDFPIHNDYRQLGMIRDLRDYSGIDLSTATTRLGCNSFSLTTVTPGGAGLFKPDEEIVGTAGADSATAMAVEYTASVTPGTGVLTYFQDDESGFAPFTVGMMITGSVSGATAVISTIVPPEIDRSSGDILYIENRRPVLRAPDQTEDIKIIVEF